MPGNPLEKRPKGVNAQTWEHNRFEDAKLEAWRGEPFKLLDTLIQNIRAGHYKGKLGQTLIRAASEVYLAANYRVERAEAEREGLSTDADEERLFADIEIVVSGNSSEGLISFADFLREVGKAVREQERRAQSFPASLVPGNDGRIRAGLLILLETARYEQKALAPTLDQLMDELRGTLP